MEIFDRPSKEDVQSRYNEDLRFDYQEGYYRVKRQRYVFMIVGIFLGAAAMGLVLTILDIIKL